MTRSLAIVLVLVMLGSTVVGCARGPRNFANENDRLRRENLELRQTVAHLEQRTSSLERAVEIERTRPDAPELPGDVDVPTVTRIQLGRFSGGIDTGNDGRDDAVRLYLTTLDARGRFVPVVGRADVSVVAVQPGEEAVTVATARFDAQQLQESYRSGLAGTHYTLVVPVAREVPGGLRSVLVRVRLTDLLTGAEHETEAVVRWSPGERQADPSPGDA